MICTLVAFGIVSYWPLTSLPVGITVAILRALPFDKVNYSQPGSFFVSIAVIDKSRDTSPEIVDILINLTI